MSNGRVGMEKRPSSHRINGTGIFTATFTIKIHHSCRRLYNCPMDPMERLSVRGDGTTSLLFVAKGGGS